MRKQQDKRQAATPDTLFVFGIDDAGKPRGARFADFNDKIVGVASKMSLTSVHPASAAFTEIAMKLPVGRLYASGKAFVPPIRRDLVDQLNTALDVSGDESQARRPPAPEQGKAASEHGPAVPPVSSGLPRNWDSIEVGHCVLVEDGPLDGYWPCLVIQKEADLLTLRLRDYPKQRQKYVRHVAQVALIYPGPAPE
jgi:hypothetical protein